MTQNELGKNELNVTTGDGLILLDLEKFNTISQGDADIRKALGDSFLAQAETVLKQMDAALDNPDKSVLHRLIHKLKGSIAFFAAEPLYVESAFLEKQCIEDHSEEFRNRIAVFKLNIRVLMREISSLNEN